MKLKKYDRVLAFIIYNKNKIFSLIKIKKSEKRQKGKNYSKNIMMLCDKF
jgi:hypothetical protein